MSTETRASHFVSAACQGVWCEMCRREEMDRPATHKVGEEILFDDPLPARHNLAVFVCCLHFYMIFGYAVPCDRL